MNRITKACHPGNVPPLKGRDVIRDLLKLELMKVPGRAPYRRLSGMTPPPSSPPHEWGGSGEGGNVLVIILIAIALMAGLTMAVMRSDVTDSDSVSPEQAKVMGSQIMSQARNFEQAITTLNARGCSEQDINFDNDAVVGYTNASAPADQTCNVFKQAGSGLSWPAPPTASNDGSAWRILAGNAIKGVTRTDDGTCVSGCIDILAVLPHVTKTVCQQLNALASVTSATAAPPVNVGNFDGATKMAGFDAVAAGSLVSDAGDVLTGKPTGCFEATNVSGVAENGTYWFYHVILKR